MTLVFLELHIATAVLDPFAHLGLRDAVIPFASSYRPLWLGLGVIAAELVIAGQVERHARLGWRFWTWSEHFWVVQTLPEPARVAEPARRNAPQPGMLFGEHKRSATSLHRCAIAV